MICKQKERCLLCWISSDLLNSSVLVIGMMSSETPVSASNYKQTMIRGNISLTKLQRLPLGLQPSQLADKVA